MIVCNTGTTALGHDFNAVGDPDSPFVKKYNHVMDSIANPAYIAFPTLEKIFPRHHTVAAIDDMVKLFQELLDVKKVNPGNDMLTYMLEDKGECRRYNICTRLSSLSVRNDRH